MDHIRAFLRDGGGNPCTMQFPVSATKVQIDAFLITYSDCGVERGNKVEAQTVTVTAAAVGSNVDRQVKCLFVFGQTREQFSSLSPKETGEVKRRQGRVFTLAEKTLFLADWKTVQGYSSAYSLRRNRFLQKR